VARTVRLAAFLGLDMAPSSSADRIDRCLTKLAPFPLAVDILRSSIGKALANPNVEKYKMVNVKNPTFQKHVGNIPGGTELLYAVGYEPLHGHLVLQKTNSTLLQRALSGLEHVQTSKAYTEAKKLAVAEQSRLQAVAQAAEDARRRRAAFLALVPPEPSTRNGPATSCAVVTVQSPSGTKVASRKFDSELHTLRDLLNFVKSLDSTPVEGNIRLENVTTAPFGMLDIESSLDRSLYSLDLWPVGQIRWQPTTSAA